MWRNREADEERGPFGLKCEAPHTYLTEQLTALGICSKGLQRDRNGNRDNKEQNILRRALQYNRRLISQRICTRKPRRNNKS